jgi:hypothetical protein
MLRSDRNRRLEGWCDDQVTIAAYLVLPIGLRM